MAKHTKKRRNVNGVLVLDKALGVTSNAALQAVKQLFDAQKAGHSGSLDPLASGVLPLCFGEATKFSQFLLEANKRYVATIKLGIVTTTGDAEGAVVKTAEVPHFSAAKLETALDKFRGEIEQIPSMYSAIKVNGKPLYKLARQGIAVERKPRCVTIHDLVLLGRTTDTLDLEIYSSKGTYIRTLAEDIGRILGCGAHLIALRRTVAGPFKIEDAVTVAELIDLKGALDFAAIDKKLLSPAASVADWPRVELTELGVSYIKQGQPIQVSKAPTAGWVSIFSASDDKDTFIGVGEIIEDGRVAPRRLVVT